MKKLTYAKNQLVLYYPFYANLLLNSPLEPKESIPTAATDGKKIFYNPKFFESLTASEVISVLCHEVLHKVFMHTLRLNERDPKIWNFATDYVINPIIKAEGLPIKDEWLYKEEYAHLTADEVYEKIKNDPPEGEAPDHLLPPEGTSSESEQRTLEQEVKQQVAAATTMAEKAGNMPAHLKKLIEDLLNPKVAWQDVLRDMVVKTQQGHEYQTWNRPNRRFIGMDMYLPSYAGTKTPPLIILFDTSGSIYGQKDLVEQFLTEIKSIAEETQPEEIHVIQTDTIVQKHDVFESGSEIELELEGGGGTNFYNFFQHVYDEDIDASAIIAMTDLYASGIPDDFPIPTIWCVYDNATPKAPFGEIIHLD